MRPLTFLHRAQVNALSPTLIMLICRSVPAGPTGRHGATGVRCQVMTRRVTERGTLRHGGEDEELTERQTPEIYSPPTPSTTVRLAGFIQLCTFDIKTSKIIEVTSRCWGNLALKLQISVWSCHMQVLFNHIFNREKIYLKDISPTAQSTYLLFIHKLCSKPSRLW